MVRENLYLKFDEIPKCFYDSSLDIGDWEEKTISELKRIGYFKEKKGEEIIFPGEANVFSDDFFDYEHDPVKYLKNNHSKLKKEYKKKQKEEKERQERLGTDTKMIYSDEDLRQFLYNKGVEIPTNEMSREFYLKNRMQKEERGNLVKLLRGYSEHLIREYEVSSRGYALFGIGTSTFSDSYFDFWKNRFNEDGFDENTEFIEKSWAIVEQNISRPKTYEEYVEQCFNFSSAFDEKIRPSSKEQFEFIKKEEQERYLKKKNLGEYFKRKGEDLDFSICLEELYGETCGNLPTNRYVENKNSVRFSKRQIDVFKENFLEYLKLNNFDFKEEISFLDSGNWDKDEKGNLIRMKNIKDVKSGVSTVRVNFTEGRSMHFYFQNEMADMKLKKERIDNSYFVQLMRGQFHFDSPFDSINDLEAAIRNGEKTGVFENPLVLKWKK